MAPCRVPPRLAAVRLGGPVGAAVGQGSRCHSCGLGVPRVLQHSRGAQGCHWVQGIPWVLKWGGALVLLGDWGSHCLSWGSGGPLGTTVGWGGVQLALLGDWGFHSLSWGGWGSPGNHSGAGRRPGGTTGGQGVPLSLLGAGGPRTTGGGQGVPWAPRGSGDPLGIEVRWGAHWCCREAGGPTDTFWGVGGSPGNHSGAWGRPERGGAGRVPGGPRRGAAETGSGGDGAGRTGSATGRGCRDSGRGAAMEAAAALTDMYDQALLGILQHVGNVEEFLRVLFGFLYRKTDFYRLLLRPGDRLGFPPGAAQAMALQVPAGRLGCCTLPALRVLLGPLVLGGVWR